MALGDELLQIPTNLPVVPAAPPAPLPPMMTPEQLAGQLAGYRNAFAGLTDPRIFDESAIRFGLNLMGPIGPGNTAGGLLAAAGNDAMNYYNARTAQERQQLFQGMDTALKHQETQGRVAATAEGVQASREKRGVDAAKAPTELAQLQANYQKARADLDLIKQEEAAGIRSPDFLTRKATAEVNLREALARMYDAHAKLYGKTADAQGSKNNKQTLNVKAVENADGTTSLVSTILVNGETYQQVFTPARFTDIQAATAQATKEVNRETPSQWNPFAGKAPYQGTAQEEIARRAKAYMEPRLVTVDPRGRQITPEQFEALGTQPGAVTPSTTPAPKPGQQPTPPDFPRETSAQRTAAEGRAVEIIKAELADARKRGATEEVEALEKELVNSAKTGKVAGKYPDAGKNVGPTQFERGADGKIVPKGTKPAAAPAAAATPSAPTSPMETAGQALDQARAALTRARQVLMTYGIRQQRADPQGYMNALSAVTKLQAEVAEKQQAYEGSIGVSPRGVSGMVRQ